MSDLKIRLLGQPEVSHLGQRLTFATRKALALLAYLATEGGMHERKKLKRLFWPEKDRAHGSTALRIALHHLRQALTEGMLPEHEAHLIVTHDALGLDLSQGVDLDVQMLGKAWRLLQKRSVPETLPGEVRRTLITQFQETAAMYRGEFLEDLLLRDAVDFDTWVEMQRQYWLKMIEQVFDYLSQLQQAEGEIERAIETIQRWCSIDPLNEDAYLRLMHLYLATGNRIAALKTYQTCVDLLQMELAASPSPQLAALAERIRTASFTPSRLSVAHNKQWIAPEPVLLNPPVVEREAEFRTRITQYVQASYGQPQAPLLMLAHLFTQLGLAYEYHNDAAAARATYQAMLETARSLHYPAMECSALNHLAVLLAEDLPRRAQALILLQEAQTVAERTHDQRGLVHTRWSLARVHYYGLDLDTSLTQSRQAYGLATQWEQQDLVAKSLNMLAYPTRALGQWEEAAFLAEEARQHFAACGDRVMEADCLSRLADAWINCGQPHKGVAAARAAYAISLQIEHPWGQANSGVQLARGLVELGSYEEALTIALQSAEVARTLTFTLLLLVNLTALGLAYQALLLPEQALAAHQEAWEISVRLSAQRFGEMNASLVCTDYALLGDWEAASRYAQHALIRDARIVAPEISRWAETEALVRAGSSKQAEEHLQLFSQRFGTKRRCRVAYVRAPAVLAHARGDRERAHACLQQAIAEAKEIGLPGELWQAEAALGQFYLEGKAHDQAADAFARAATVVERLASKIASETLRSHFLASPQVQQLLMLRSA